MGYFKNIAKAIINKSADGDVIFNLKNSPDELFGKFNPYASDNYYTSFKTIAEVQYPIRFICDRAKNAKFVLKKWSDDSVVWNNKQINKFLENPNPFYSFKDLLANYIQMKFVLGNAFLYANVNPSMKNKIWQYCDSYYILPTQNISIETKKVSTFNIENIKDIVNYYKLKNTNIYNGTYSKLDPNIVMHSRDYWDFDNNDDLLSFSRLESIKYPLANLCAVYEARNVIYTKRGALGAIVLSKKDADGLQASTPTEKEEVQKEFENKYGLNNKKHLFQITRFPIDFVKFGATISELQPFEETLQDAIQIAGVFGVNKELIPRKDNSTFSNQNSAEISAYNNTVIPIVKIFLSEINDFLGLNDSGYYIDSDWSEVNVLQQGKIEEQNKKKIISERCGNDFKSGIITLNDWRAELGLEAIEIPLYNKTIIEMKETELNKLKNILSL